MIKKYNDIKPALEKIRLTGNPRGGVTGFITFDEFYSVKLGTYTFIQGAPHSGKTELVFEICINQAEKYDYKILVATPETGTAEEVFAEIFHKITGKPFFGAVEDKKYYAAINWIDTHFNIVDMDEKALSFQELFGLCTDEQIIVADPYNEFRHSMEGYGSRQDLQIEDELGEVRRWCKKKNKHIIFTIHPGTQSMREEKIFNNGSKGSYRSIKYYPMPHAREAAGGQALLRKAMTWINIWLPTPGLKDATGRFYEKNEMVYYVEKAKPKGVAKKGFGKLFLDESCSRYYEKHRNLNLYAFQHEKLPEMIGLDTEPEIDFTNAADEEDVLWQSTEA